MADRNIDGKIQVPFEKASTLSNLDGTGNGENIVTAFGKLAKWYDSLVDKIEKGDVFGTNATQLDNTKDINTTITQGIYYWTQSSKPANLPKRKLISENTTLSQGILLVFRPKNYSSVIQLIIPVNVYTADGWSIYIRTSTDSRSTALPSVAWHLIESTEEFDTVPTSGSANGITSDAVFNALQNAITDAVNALDVSDITQNLGVDKTITALSETDGKISATASAIQITESQVTDLTTDLSNKQAKLVVGTNLDSTPTDGSNNPVTSDGVYDALGTKQDTITFDGTYSASTNPASTVSTVSNAISALNLGDAATRAVTTLVTSGSTALLTSGGAYTQIPKIALLSGTEITSSSLSPANFNDYTSAGRYYTTTASASNSMLNSPTKALGAGSDGKITIDGTVVTFNANLELIVEELALYSTETYVLQTVIYSYNSASSGTGPTTGRNFTRSRIFRRMKDYAGWSNWYMYTGTEIVPPAT